MEELIQGIDQSQMRGYFSLNDLVCKTEKVRSVKYDSKGAIISGPLGFQNLPQPLDSEIFGAFLEAFYNNTLLQYQVRGKVFVLFIGLVGD